MTSALVVAHAAIALHGTVDSMKVDDDGSVRLAVEGADGGALVQRLDPAGAALPAQQLVAPSPSVQLALPALSWTGAFALTFTGTSSRGINTLTSTGIDGAADAPPQTLALDRTAIPGGVGVGPTGAVAVVSTRTTDGKINPLLLFRPAGATVFNAPIRTGRRISPYSAYRNWPAQFALAFTQDGGAVLLTTPSGYPQKTPFLRRISPAGAFGPRIPLAFGKHERYWPRLATGSDGTIAVTADATDIPGQGSQTHKRGDHLYVATVAPGAATATVQALGKGNLNSGVGGDLHVSVGAGDRITVLTSAGTKDTSNGLRLFEGPAGALTQTAFLKADEPSLTKMLPQLDGGLAVVWSSAGRTASNATDSYTTVVARRPPGGTFGAPHAIDTQVPVKNTSDLPSQVAPLPNGDAVLVFTRFDLTTGDSGSDWVTEFTP